MYDMFQDSLGSLEHRQAILISGTPHCTEGKLLAVPTVADGTGLSQAQATYRALEDWECEKSVIGLCFDTTSSNTGRVQGAVVQLESMLGQPLLQLACRHHILELIVGAVAITVFGRTTAPTEPLFQHLRRRWDKLDLSTYRKLQIEHLAGETWLMELRDEAVRFLGAASGFLRDDYREVAEITLLVLGTQPRRGTHLMRPGAYHHARWMAKIIYYTKLLMFSSQLEFDDELVQKLQRVVLFTALLYAPAWLAAPVAADAPLNDLLLYQRLLQYRTVDREIAEASLAVIRRHLWYLRPQTVVFALCSDKVEDTVKQEMAKKLSRLAVPEDFTYDNVSVDDTTRLPDLVDESSWFVFTGLQVCESTWLTLPVDKWDQDRDYCDLKHIVSHLKVTNDVAERGIKLIQDYANTVTKDELQLQGLLQLVEKSRKELGDFKKSALAKMT